MALENLIEGDVPLLEKRGSDNGTFRVINTAEDGSRTTAKMRTTGGREATYESETHKYRKTIEVEIQGKAITNVNIGIARFDDDRGVYVWHNPNVSRTVHMPISGLSELRDLISDAQSKIRSSRRSYRDGKGDDRFDIVIKHGNEHYTIDNRLSALKPLHSTNEMMDEREMVESIIISYEPDKENALYGKGNVRSFNYGQFMIDKKTDFPLTRNSTPIRGNMYREEWMGKAQPMAKGVMSLRKYVIGNLFSYLKSKEMVSEETTREDLDKAIRLEKRLEDGKRPLHLPNIIIHDRSVDAYYQWDIAGDKIHTLTKGAREFLQPYVAPTK